MAKKGKSRSRSTRQAPDCSELLVLELQEINSAESQLSRTLPRLSRAVENETLRKLLDSRVERGERLLSELESAFDELDESPGRRKNVAAEGLINDLREHMQEIEAGPALDAVLIAGIQKTEHYCIAAWGTARALAEATDSEAAAAAMKRALDEGKKFDAQLTQLAEKEVTPALLSAEDAESADDSEDDDEERSDGQKRSRKSSSSEQRTSR